MAGPGSGFLKRAVIADSTAHRPVPTPFREGTCFDSAGFATPRRPWLRDIPTVPEPCRGSLHAAMAKIDRNSFPPNKPGRGQTWFPPGLEESPIQILPGLATVDLTRPSTTAGRDERHSGDSQQGRSRRFRDSHGLDRPVTVRGAEGVRQHKLAKVRTEDHVVSPNRRDPGIPTAWCRQSVEDARITTIGTTGQRPRRGKRERCKSPHAGTGDDR